MTESDLASSELKPLYDAVQRQESGGKKDAVSSKGAQGLMQIMPDTAKEIARELDLKNYDLKDPTTNRLMGEYYLAKMLDKYGDVQLALAAYNAGPGKVDSWIKMWGKSWDEIASNLKATKSHKETLAYVPSVLDRIV